MCSDGLTNMLEDEEIRMILQGQRDIVEKAEEGVAITVFFDEEATQEQKDAIGVSLENAEGVLEVNYVSAEEAWEKSIQVNTTKLPVIIPSIAP